MERDWSVDCTPGTSREDTTLGRARASLEDFRGSEVADLVGDPGAGGPRLVFVGINPSLMTAATGTHFAHPSNRFYPSLHAAGLTDRRLPRGVAHSDDDRRQLTDRGIAITNIVGRATARASELSDDELRAGVPALEAKLERWRPVAVAFTGVTAYRTAFGEPDAALGRQDRELAGAEVWVVPNPSGLNAHETIESLAAWYRRVAEAAGVTPSGPTRDASAVRRRDG
jgi:double-stranded uracil-DNA glycosylase